MSTCEICGRKRPFNCDCTEADRLAFHYQKELYEMKSKLAAQESSVVELQNLIKGRDSEIHILKAENKNLQKECTEVAKALANSIGESLTAWEKGALAAFNLVADMAENDEVVEEAGDWSKEQAIQYLLNRVRGKQLQEKKKGVPS